MIVLAPGDGAITDRGLRAFAGYGMKRAFNAIRADVTEALRPHGLRMVTYSALSVIAENPGLRQAQLAGALAIERPNIGPLVDELEQAGLIVRVRPPEDRRAYALTATDIGRQVLAQSTQAVTAHDRRMTAGLTEAERATLIDLLARIEKGGRE